MQFDGLVDIAVGDQVEDRRKGLLLHDVEVVAGLGNARCDIAAAGVVAAGKRLAAVQHLSALVGQPP